VQMGERLQEVISKGKLCLIGELARWSPESLISVRWTGFF
jgi:hypothetical protein